jgi:hypothetical protein
MEPTQARLRSGSTAEPQTTGAVARAASGWEPEWHEADTVDRNELERARRTRMRRAIAVLAPSALVAALVPAIFPLTPGFSASETAAAVVAAVVTAVVALAVIPLADRLARGLPRAGAGDSLVFTIALLSAGAAAIHFAVVKMHFAEYTLFGVFFVVSGIAQLVWPLWLLLRRWRPLLLLGAVGNAAIVALWAVDRIWGLPLGPMHWKPDPVGFGDSAASAFELLLVAGCVTLLVRRHGGSLRGRGALALTLCVLAPTALGLLSVLGVGSSFLTPSQ